MMVISVVVLASLSVYLYVELQHEKNRGSDLKDKLSSLTEEYHDYKATHYHNNSEYWKAFFHFYYVKQEKQRFGNTSIFFELSDLSWTEPYQEGTFDCGEMSACLERYLENRGWHVKIVGGDSPAEGEEKHAWLLVETSQGKYTPIESVNIEEISQYNRYYDNYFIYEYEFESIQEAIEFNASDFDWWKLDFCPLEYSSIFDD